MAHDGPATVRVAQHTNVPESFGASPRRAPEQLQQSIRSPRAHVHRSSTIVVHILPCDHSRNMRGQDLHRDCVWLVRVIFVTLCPLVWVCSVQGASEGLGQQRASRPALAADSLRSRRSATAQSKLVAEAGRERAMRLSLSPLSTLLLLSMLWAHEPTFREHLPSLP